MKYDIILKHLYPTSAYTVDSDGNILFWGGPGKQPTKADMERAWPKAEAMEKNQVAERSRHSAYVSEADPLFMYWQAGEGTEAAWKAKRAEIRQRFPYVPVP